MTNAVGRWPTTRLGLSQVRTRIDSVSSVSNSNWLSQSCALMRCASRLRSDTQRKRQRIRGRAAVACELPKETRDSTRGERERGWGWVCWRFAPGNHLQKIPAMKSDDVNSNSLWGIVTNSGGLKEGQRMSNGRPTMRDYIDKMHQSALGRVEGMSNSDVLSKTVDAWIDQLSQEYASADIPVLDTQRISRTASQGEVPAYSVPNPRFSSAPKVPGLIHNIHVPFQGQRNFFFYHPDGWMDEFPGCAVMSDELVLSIGGAWYTSKQIEEAVDRQIADIENALQGFRSDADRFRQNFPGLIRPSLERRRQSADTEAQTAAGLKYPIKQRPEAAQTYTVPAIRRKIAPVPIPSTAPSPDPALHEDHYLHILNVIEHMTKVMERSPAAFVKMEEEHLRFHYLVQLNGQYDGVAGEAFNFEGHTDILVKQGNHNLFVAECKFWSGPEGLNKTVAQLFKYVTWRDTKMAIIMFVNRKDFTAAVITAVDTMAKHPLLVGQPKKEGETRFRYTLRMPNDPQRHITMTLLLFDVPK